MKKLLNKTILVTGGTGFIGSHLIRILLKKKHRIIVLKRKSSDTWRINDLLNKVSIYNIEEIKSLDVIFKKHKIDIIIHLAGKYIKFHKTAEDVVEMNRSNIDFPTILLESAIKNNIFAFINTGTFFEYKLNRIINEKTIIEPYDYYAVTKQIFEQTLKSYCQKQKIKAVTLKLFSPYGEKDNEKLIPLLLKSLISGEKISLTKGNQKLCFTYVEDIIDAYVKAIDFVFSKDYQGYENFNVSTDKSWSIKQLIEKIDFISNKKMKVKFGTLHNSKDEIVNIKCDLTKAKKMLKWFPKISLEEGLKKTYIYYNNLLKND